MGSGVLSRGYGGRGVKLRIRVTTPSLFHGKWAPVTTALRVLGVRMEERPPVWRVASNILNKQSRTAEKGRSSSLGVGRGVNNYSPYKVSCYELFTKASDPDWSLGTKTYRTIILPVMLYGCETWSLKFREERSLRVFQNMVLRRIFGPNMDEVTGEWRKLHNEELNDLYCSPNIVRVITSRRIKLAVHVARMEERRAVYRALMGRPEGKRPLGRSRPRW